MSSPERTAEACVIKARARLLMAVDHARRGEWQCFDDLVVSAIQVINESRDIALNEMAEADKGED